MKLNGKLVAVWVLGTFSNSVLAQGAFDKATALGEEIQTGLIVLSAIVFTCALIVLMWQHAYGHGRDVAASLGGWIGKALITSSAVGITAFLFG